MKRLVLMVEGEGDARAVPVLVKRLLHDYGALGGGDVYLDTMAMKVGNLERFFGSTRERSAEQRRENWVRLVQAASRRESTAGILAVFDGDQESVAGKPFCPWTSAATLAAWATEARAGDWFSFACVIACKEYESWLLAGAESLAGRLIGTEALIPAGERAPDEHRGKDERSGKRWLLHATRNRYKETEHQKPLTELVDLGRVRERELRSFRRLESGVREIVSAVQSGKHISTPTGEERHADAT